MAKDLKIGDLVWAKMKGFPPWPAKIIKPSKYVKPPKQKKPQHYVYFFGSYDYAWILDENIVLHNDIMVQNANKKKSATYQSAVEAIVSQSKSNLKSKNVHKVLKKEEQNADEKSPQIKTPNQNKTRNSVNNVPKKSGKNECFLDAPVQRKTAKKRPTSLFNTDTNVAESSVSCPKSQRVETDYADLLASVPPNIGYSDSAAIPSYDSYQSREILSRPEYIERPPTPILDISDISEVLRSKKIVACSKKIGFLGLGNMGQGMVKNLLNSGHCVTVWNRTPEKMDAFLKAGASKAQTPSDVIQGCDITFCCVSDAKAVKGLVFGNCGVLKGLEACSGSSKGYVEMTVLDPKTSQEVEAGIISKGGQYLEAPIAGSKKNALEGTLFFRAAGNLILFRECETCFNAMGRAAYYVGSKVGTASKMNIIFSLLHGTMYAAIAEAMALVDRCKLSQEDFLKSFESEPLDCQAVHDIGHAVIDQNYSANTSLKHVQQNLNMALALSTSTDQPVPVAAAANEVYKQAKRLRYSDHDVSAVYEAARF